MMKPQLDLYRKLNTSLLPIHPDSKAYDMYALRQRGYCTLSEVKQRGIKAPDIVAWWPAGVHRNTAIITTDQLFVLDFDDEAQFWRYCAEYSAWAATMTVRSPNGYHVYYRLREPLQHKLISAWPGVEVKSCGDCILCPPSRIGTRFYQPIGVVHRPLTLPDWSAISFLAPGKGKEMGQRLGSDGVFSSYRAMGGLGGVAPHRERSAHGASERNSLQTQSIISIIKKSLSISALLRWLEYDLVRSGEGYYLTSCPFHDDKHPSFWINDAEGMCNCFRVDCMSEKPMDVLDLYQRLHCCGLRESIWELARALGI